MEETLGLKLRKNRAPSPNNVCPLSKSMALLRGAWTAEIIWCLSAGPRRFGELRADLPSITAKVLTERLRHLESKGIIQRLPIPTSPPSVEYKLTVIGAKFLTAIHAIAKVGDELKFGMPDSEADLNEY